MILVHDRLTNFQININHMGLHFEIELACQMPLPGEACCGVSPIFDQGGEVPSSMTAFSFVLRTVSGSFSAQAPRLRIRTTISNRNHREPKTMALNLDLVILELRQVILVLGEEFVRHLSNFGQ